MLRIRSSCSKSTFDQNRKLSNPPLLSHIKTTPHIKTTLWMRPPLWSKSHSYFVAFFLKVILLTEVIAAKGTSKSRNDVKKLKIPKNEAEKPELSNPSTTATYTVAISSIHSSVYLKINRKSQSNLFWQIDQLQLHQQYLHLNPLLILMLRKCSVSLNVKLKTVKVINQNQNKWNFHLTLLTSESYFSLLLLCK